MTVRPGKSAEKPKISPALFGAALVLLLLVVSASAFLALRPPSAEVPKGSSSSPFVSEEEKWIRQKAEEVQGDFSKLTPAEQGRVNIYAQGKGEWYLKYFYEQMHSKKP